MYLQQSSEGKQERIIALYAIKMNQFTTSRTPVNSINILQPEIKDWPDAINQTPEDLLSIFPL